MPKYATRSSPGSMMQQPSDAAGTIFRGPHRESSAPPIVRCFAGARKLLMNALIPFRPQELAISSPSTPIRNAPARSRIASPAHCRLGQTSFGSNDHESPQSPSDRHG